MSLEKRQGLPRQRISICIALALSLALLAVFPACARPLSLDADDPLPVDRKQIRGVLPDGLSWYLRPTSSPDDRILFRLVVAVGASDERDSERGYAHFVEHMAFNGTRRYPGNALDDLMISLDRGRDLEMNAFTYPDYTIYLLEIPSNNAKALELGIGILREWASGLLFDPKEVEREKGVIRAEMREYDTLADHLRQREEDALYAGTFFAGRDVLGTLDSIDRTDAQGLKDFYNRHYRPERMAVIVSGPLDPAKARADIEKSFADLPGDTARQGPRSLRKLPLPSSLCVVRETDFRRKRTEVRLLFREGAASVRSGADILREYRAVLCESVLAGRLEALGLDPKVPWTYVGAKRWYERGGERLWEISISAPAGSEAESLRSLGRELGALSAQGADADEAGIAARDAVQSLPPADPDGYEATEAALYSFLYGDTAVDPDSTRALENRLRESALGKDSPAVGTAPADLPSLEAGVLSVVSPRRLSASDEDLLEAFRAGVKTGRVEGTAAGADSSKNGLARLPNTWNEPQASRFAWKDGTVELTLSNGLRVLLRATDSGEGWVFLAARSPGGLSAVPKTLRAAADEAPDILRAAGFPAAAPGALHAELAGTWTEWTADVADSEELIEADGSADDLELLFRLMAASFTPPAASEGSLRKAAVMRAEELRTLAGPETEFRFAVDEELGQGSGPVDPDSVESLTPGQVVSAWEDRFGDASDFTFLAAGDFDLAKAKRFAEKYLSALSVHGRREAPPAPATPPAPGLRIERAPVGAKRGRVEAVWSLRGLPSADAASMESLARALEAFLFRGIREEHSATYDVWCSWDPSFGNPGSGEFRVEFEAAPGLARPLADELTRELESFASGKRLKASTDAGRTGDYKPRDEDVYQSLLAEVRGAFLPDSADEAPTSERLARLAAQYLQPKDAAVFVLASE